MKSTERGLISDRFIPGLIECETWTGEDKKSFAFEAIWKEVDKKCNCLKHAAFHSKSVS